MEKKIQNQMRNCLEVNANATSSEPISELATNVREMAKKETANVAERIYGNGQTLPEDETENYEMVWLVVKGILNVDRNTFEKAFPYNSFCTVIYNRYNRVKILDNVLNKGSYTVKTDNNQNCADVHYDDIKKELNINFYTQLFVPEGSRTEGIFYTITAKDKDEILKAVQFVKGICNDNVTDLWDNLTKEKLDELWKR